MKNNFINKSEMDTNEDTEIQNARIELVKWWFDDTASNQMNTLSNEDFLKEMIAKSFKNGREIVFVATGCQNWVDVFDDDDQTIPMIKLIPMKGRSQRFAKEIASFQNALTSFDVPNVVFLTLSNVDSILHMNEGKMPQGVTLDEVKKICDESATRIENMISKNGGNAIMFDHLDIVSDVLGEQNLNTLARQISDNEELNDESFLFKLYELDSKILGNQLVQKAILGGSNPLGFVWIDMMSPIAGIHREMMHKFLKENAVDLPIINPFANAGKWDTAVCPKSRFSTKLEFLSTVLNIPTSSRETWIRNLLSKSDEDIELLLQRIGVKSSINSMIDKNRAVSKLETIIFGSSNIREDIGTEKVMVLKNDSSISLIARKTSQPRNHIRSLLREGGIRVDGEKVFEDFELLDGQILSVGKKIKFKLEIDDE